MKKILILSTVLSALCGFADDARFAVTATATTRDGSIIKGPLQTEALTGSTLFCEKLTLTPEQLASLTFTQTNGTARAKLSNGDVFTYQLANADIVIDSSLGRLKVPCNSLRSLTFAKRRVTNGGSELVFSCDFETEAEIPGFKGGTIVGGKTGNALHVPPRTSAAKVDLPAGTIGSEGTIEFWGKIDADAYMEDGGCPRFFEIIDMVSKREISQDWNINNGSSGRGLTFRMDGLPPMVSSNYRKYNYESILGNPSGWHHYALVWKTDGLDITAPVERTFSLIRAERENNQKPKAAVFVDGRCQMASFSKDWEGSKLLETSSTLFFPSREDEMPDYARVGYTIDNFKIWSCAKTEFGE